MPPPIHFVSNKEKKLDFAFVGNVFPGPRQELLERLQSEFPDSFVGNVYFEEMARTYGEARIVFNRSVRNDINMRVFEALAAGSLLITNDLAENGQNELFEVDRELVTFGDEDDLLAKFNYYLRNEQEREAIAARGQQAVLGRHTYRHRMQRVVEVASQLISETGGSRELPSESGSVGTKPATLPETPSSKLEPLPRMELEVAAPLCVGPGLGSRAGRPLEGKSSSYFGFPRPEVVELVPLNARRILDVGCGAGALGEAIKQRQLCDVTGIELEPFAAQVARTKLDRVLIGNLESDNFDLEESEFDSVICADILEHLRTPDAVLKRLRRHLAADGTLVVSIPNVRHLSLLRSLAAGNWTYEAAGLLDDDHARFFTRREFEKVLFRAGFEVQSCDGVHTSEVKYWNESNRALEINLGNFQVQCRSEPDAEEFFVYQWLFRARPRIRSRRKIRHIRSHVGASTAESLARLRQEFPWPIHRPVVPFPTSHSGWFVDGARQLLDQVVSSETHVVLELGAWLGASTRFIAATAPNATIISVDHWEGSHEHRNRPEWAVMLPHLYKTFLSQNWNYRDRIVPLRMGADDAIKLLLDAHITPDVIYVDIDHDYEPTRQLVERCVEAFPDSIVCGDDLDAEGVTRAVEEVGHRNAFEIVTTGNSWKGWRLSRPADEVEVDDNVSDYGLTSIVIVTHNEIGCTHECLESIRMRTVEPYEVIVVDNGSTDRTIEDLSGMPAVTLIQNDNNLGFPAAANQGIRAARGRNILLLNNDTVVTTGWLTRLLDVLYSDSSIGLVGPSSNNVSGPQQIDVDYQEVAELDGFAWEIGKAHAGIVESCSRLVGFCLLMRREVIDRIGFLDERFGIGCFEDDDLCLRAEQAGFGLVIARDAFVHHVGSQTFRASNADFTEIMEANRKRFEEKWGTGHTNQPVTSTHRVQPALQAVRAESGGLLLKKTDLKVSLCMIVRDNESTIGPCLESIRPWVDEIVVVDTGSVDRTPEICRDLGARVFEFPWCDDFAVARNESLKYARGEWIFWMDSDDSIPEECGQRLRRLVDGSHKDATLGYVMQVHCPGHRDNGQPEVTAVDHVKLFRNRTDLRFEGRIHEQIIPPIRRAGGEVDWTDIFVIHSGADHSPDGRRRKLERDYRLLHLDLKDRPNHPFVLFNLGMTYADDHKWDIACDYLTRSIECSHPGESHLRKAYALLVSSLKESARITEAMAVCETGLKLFPTDPELVFRRAMLHHDSGEFALAKHGYEALLDASDESYYASIDLGITGYKARHNLAAVLSQSGDHAAAERHWRALLKEMPDYVPAWIGLGDTLIASGNEDEFDELCLEGEAHQNLAATILLLKARKRLAENEFTAARSLLEEAITVDEENLDALQELCRLLFEQGHLDDAKSTLRRLTKKQPADGSALHNLASVHAQLGEVNQAIEAFEQSLLVRPDSRQTWIEFCQTLRLAGREHDATFAENHPGEFLRSIRHRQAAF